MTFNEEANIARCLDSVSWSNDVVVLDSFSDDRTVEIARTYDNVTIHQHEFHDYGSQRNFGLRNITYRNPWLLMIDADEAVEPELVAELCQVVSRGAEVRQNVFLMRRKVFVEDRRLKRNLEYDIWHGRFMRPAAVRFEGAVHEKPVFEGDYGLLDNALEHHPFTKGVKDWLARRCRYARIEAETAKRQSLRPRQLLSGNVIVRRAALKRLYTRLPAKWLVYLAYNLAFKFPYLDGWRGLRYIMLETYSLILAARQGKERKDDRAHKARPADDFRAPADRADLFHD